MNAFARHSGWLGLGLLMAACVGNIGDPPVGQSQDPLCTKIEPGKSPIRRMTRTEYNNTIYDLLGDDTQPASTFVIEEEALGFNNQATALGVTQLLAEQYMLASEAISERAVGMTQPGCDGCETSGRCANNLATLIPGCDPDVQGPEVCADQFIEQFGKRAFRRPLDASEMARFADLFAWGNAQWNVATGIELVIQAMLQSPHFLYRVEVGMPDPIEDDVVPLTHYEMASRLSYMLWNSMPDDELFAAADAGQLGTGEQIEAQTRRMLNHPRAREAVANFHRQWLQLVNIDTVNKNTAVYPSYSGDLRPLWRNETEAFIDYVVFDDIKGDVATLLTAPYTFLNHDLAEFYGIQSGPQGDAFEKVSLDSTQRAGFLTQASLMAALSKPNQSSPVHRGKFVRERLLCQTLPPPPNDIDIQPPEVEPGVSTRERFNQHSDDPTCSGCHRLMDPIGFGFEHYDGIGLWRDMDQGEPVDASGQILESHDIDGAFDGAVELAHRLAESDQVRECVARQWFRFGYGRAEAADDQCNMHQIQQAFAEGGYNIKELLVALTQTDAFRYRHKAITGQ